MGRGARRVEGDGLCESVVETRPGSSCSRVFQASLLLFKRSLTLSFVLFPQTLQLDPSPADNFRLFAEESDLLQGVQLSLDISTGFAAMACEMLGEFKDDYPKGDAISIGLMGGLLGGGGERQGGEEAEADATRNMREISVSPPSPY